MDQSQRRHERAAASGEVDAAARVLAERVRSGQLGRSWVHLLYLLGDAAAAGYLGASPLAREDPDGWLVEELIAVWGEALWTPALEAANELLEGSASYRPLTLYPRGGRYAIQAICSDLCAHRGLGRRAALAAVAGAMTRGLMPWARAQGADPRGVDPASTAVLCWLAEGRYPSGSRSLLRQLGVRGLQPLSDYETDLAIPRGLGDFMEALEVRFGGGVEGAAAACAAAKDLWEAELGDWSPVQGTLDALEAFRQGRGSAGALRRSLDVVRALAEGDERRAAIVDAVARTCAAATASDGRRTHDSRAAALRLGAVLGEGCVGDAIQRRIVERASAGLLVLDAVGVEVCASCGQASCAGASACDLEDEADTRTYRPQEGRGPQVVC